MKIYGVRNFGKKQLKINGYFIEQTIENSPRVFFLYANGIFLDWGGVDNGTIEVINNKIREIDSLQYHKLTPYHWGLFQANSEEVIIEKWLSGNGGPYPVERYEGEILNDTTISIFISDHKLLGHEKSQIYRFRHFSSKPDSTNTFIK